MRAREETWILCVEDSEGLGEPFLTFDTKEQAEEIASIIEAFKYHNTKIIKADPFPAALSAIQEE